MPEPYDAETRKYHNKAMVEIWMGRAATNIGDLRGAELYQSMRSVLPAACAASLNKAWNICTQTSDEPLRIKTHYVKDVSTGEIGVSKSSRRLEKCLLRRDSAIRYQGLFIVVL
jgi:hypothetical protein